MPVSYTHLVKPSVIVFITPSPIIPYGLKGGDGRTTGGFKHSPVICNGINIGTGGSRVPYSVNNPSMTAVSYTHLDVYKRQPLDRPVERLAPFL